MRNLELDLKQRIALGAVVGAQQGRIADIVIFSRILEKTRLSEAEQKAVQLRPAGESLIWDPPQDPAFGRAKVAFEDEEARKLREVLEGWPHFTPADVGWVQPLIEALRG